MKELKVPVPPLECGDISCEVSRTYTILIEGKGALYEIFIINPKKVYYGSGHGFHRVFDGVNVHLCPAPGPIYHNGKIIGFCEVSWEPKDKENPCKW